MNEHVPGRRLQISVLGAASCDEALRAAAYEVGERIALAGACLVTGGRGGVMAAASRGAREAGGLVIGVLPGTDAASSEPNEDLSAALFTGLGQARNLSVVLSGAAAIAVGGSWGTLSEIALARKHGIPVVLLRSWSLALPDGRPDPGLVTAASPAEAVEKALELADRGRLGL